MTGPASVNISYGEFWLIIDDGRLDTSNLSVCGWCAAVVNDEAKHTAFHSCGCPAEFRVQYEGHFHDPEACPLSTDCGGPTSDPPCGGCDRCQLAQTLHGLRRTQERMGYIAGNGQSGRTR